MNYIGLITFMLSIYSTVGTRNLNDDNNDNGNKNKQNNFKWSYDGNNLGCSSTQTDKSNCYQQDNEAPQDKYNRLQCSSDIQAFWCNPTNISTYIDGIVFHPFSTYYVPSYGIKQYQVSTPINNSGDFLPVYQSECGDHDMTFAFPLPRNDCYNVTLLEAEIYWGNIESCSQLPGGTCIGYRKFNVFLNGNQWLTNTDIYSSVGSLYANNISKNIRANQWLNVTFVAVSDTAKLAGIIVQPSNKNC